MHVVVFLKRHPSTETDPGPMCIDQCVVVSHEISPSPTPLLLPAAAGQTVPDTDTNCKLTCDSS